MHFVGPKLSKISNVTVERIDREALEVCWETPLRDLMVSIYMGSSPVTIDRRSPAARIRGRNTARISELDPEVRYYFEVVPEGGPGVITAERLVPLQGSWNFRDLGGYKTSNGSRVKWGQIFRSDNLSNLTERDQALLKRIGIKLVCDLRTPPELNRWPDRLPDDDSIDYLQLPIIHGEREFDFYYEKMGKGEVSWLTEEFMIDANIRKAHWALVLRATRRYGQRSFSIWQLTPGTHTGCVSVLCASGTVRLGAHRFYVRRSFKGEHRSVKPSRVAVFSIALVCILAP